MPTPFSLSLPSRPRLRKGLIALARWVCAGILLYAAGRQIVAELRKLEDRPFNLDMPLLLAGAVLYGVAMASFAAYWRQAALDMGGRPGRLEVLRAYFASQLGKYIPGKAWVVLIRCALIDSQSTTASVIIASTFYETLAMMAAGSLLALVALLLVGNADRAMLMLSGGLAAGLALAVFPPVFGRLTLWTTRSLPKLGTIPIPAITYAAWFQGFRYCIPGWAAAGLSLLAIAGSLGISMFTLVGFELACGAIALAMVSGFAVLVVPAGLGVREWVLMQILGPSIGTSNALLVAILTRITHVCVELLVAGSLYLLGRRSSEND